MANGTIQMTGIQTWILWENDNPSASFTAQTISMDLSDYDAVLIVFGGNTTYNNNVLSEIILKNDCQFMLSCVLAGSSNVRNRGVTVNNSGVVFSGGYQGGSANNNAVIPRLICGIKGIPI